MPRTIPDVYAELCDTVIPNILKGGVPSIEMHNFTACRPKRGSISDVLNIKQSDSSAMWFPYTSSPGNCLGASLLVLTLGFMDEVLLPPTLSIPGAFSALYIWINLTLVIGGLVYSMPLQGSTMLECLCWT
jgi:hypothetical protein